MHPQPTLSFRFALLALFSVLALSSCREGGCLNEEASNYDPDADHDDGSCIYLLKPTVEVNAPSGTIAYTGEAVSGSASFADDQGLASARLELYRMFEPEVVYETTFDLSGTQTTELFSLTFDPQHPVYETAPFFGEYEIILTAIDIDEQETSTRAFFTLEDAQEPALNFLSFSDSIQAGEVITFKLQLEDPGNLREVVLNLLDVSNGNPIPVASETVTFPPNTRTITLERSFTDSNLAAGSSFILSATAFDISENRGQVSTEPGTVF